MFNKYHKIFKIISNLNFIFSHYLQSASSPRRVAVPVLVKDGKPCSSSSNSTNQQQQQQVTSGNTSVGGGGGGGSVGGNNLIPDGPNTHSPDTSSTLLSSYNGGQHAQMLQQPCNNALMSNSLAMAYRNQNNFMTNSHQQQCGSYLPLQGRAW